MKTLNFNGTDLVITSISALKLESYSDKDVVISIITSGYNGMCFNNSYESFGEAKKEYDRILGEIHAA